MIVRKEGECARQSAPACHDTAFPEYALESVDVTHSYCRPAAIQPRPRYVLGYCYIMKSGDSIGLLVQQVRQHAHLTQRELAERVGTSQSAIAKLEQGESNPTIDTLERCAAAAGLAVKFTLVPLPVADPVIEQYKRGVDRSLLRANRKKSVHERLQSLGEWQADLSVLHHAVTRARAKRVAEAPLPNLP